MNKTDFVKAIAEKADFSKKDAEKALNAVLDVITETLAEGDKIQLVGFGSFEVRDRAARIGHNPRTKEPIEIPATRLPVFKPGKALKNAVDVK
jgi:DNA-binding protein HU-beta